jgi:hypothetical protein
MRDGASWPVSLAAGLLLTREPYMALEDLWI